MTSPSLARTAPGRLARPARRALLAHVTGLTPETVHLVWERDGGACARCGSDVRRQDRGTGWSLHHRRRGGRDGSRRIGGELPGNLAVLCGSGFAGCSGWVEGNRSTATESGWRVSALTLARPSDIPYFHAMYGYGRALDSGLFERVPS